MRPEIDFRKPVCYPQQLNQKSIHRSSCYEALEMLTFWGGKHRFCDNISRRDFLRIGALGLGGLTMPDLLRLQAHAKPEKEKRPRAVIMVCLAGGPSHLDMYDLKPDAPAEFRGEFQPIRTR